MLQVLKLFIDPPCWNIHVERALALSFTEKSKSFL